MAFPVIPIICALALYILHDSEDDQTEKTPKVKKNKSVKITSSDIDDNSKTVPVSAPTVTENSVPTTEDTPGDPNVQ